MSILVDDNFFDGDRVFINGAGFNEPATVVDPDRLQREGWKMLRGPVGSEVLVLPDSLKSNAFYLPARILKPLQEINTQQ